MKKFIMILLVCAGCSQTTLHPIQKADIYRIKTGECKAEKDGWFISDFYLEEVMKAKMK